ncbi:vacuolar protein sorting-associated protein 2 homolog 2-like [Lycium barbarum]|uniref:vacuolar protein sorting-associated protein 2 homolog 2-like n=1 Tax=Lycium barbarum TaxID=112863 RepID=UPI00293E9172|nr:vacuolar protein sorting-associated protein 2 homolog 2-like [Lycium barbarum]XP_060192388.1 vacuolar protein sorting-associated protein 2 homolog 2-like [Lycium barbarum]XP_060192389.1 vacuolar protein sorting-associated protein 2 homolog 2-like [Lycium barbarum]XP_060192390.1 vacuolar protein sorting-associated protein 2 homolog 2-like [Lycium barbarum]XP_060192391.1 vacuolar protein sorting-associated protein 2 homolog 2-like [Lycium barbarum]XP_060192392.1 vacuolar protein sorting-assoc
MAAAKQVKVIREFKKQSSQLDMTNPLMRLWIKMKLKKKLRSLQTSYLQLQKVGYRSQKCYPPPPPPSSDSAADVDECEKRLASLRRI